MSEFQFIESLSADPVERAIADRVAGILNNPRLNRDSMNWNSDMCTPWHGCTAG